MTRSLYETALANLKHTGLIGTATRVLPGGDLLCVRLRAAAVPYQRVARAAWFINDKRTTQREIDEALRCCGV